MGHRISGFVIPGDIDVELASQFEARIVPLRKEFTAIAICDEYIDDWAERLALHDETAEMPLIKSRVVRHIATKLAGDRPFALIETDYFGGEGWQWAAAYIGEVELVPMKKAESGPINAALKAIGVRSWLGDAFSAIGLGEHRDWDDLFEEHY